MKKPYLAFIALLGLAFLIVTPGVSLAAMDIFVKVGDLEGESTDDQHMNWIDALSYSGAVFNDAAGRSCFDDISFVHRYDKASPSLSLYAAMGTLVREVLIHFEHASTPTQSFLEIILTDATITSVSSGGSGGEDILNETVTFTFNTIKWRYTAPGSGVVEEEVENVERCNGSGAK
jgi:type VI secretion system secreted protein Hcp